jgi:tetratricopeptide (TPR) repeat protein
MSDQETKQPKPAVPAPSQLWQIPTILLALLVFFVAVYIAWHPVRVPSTRAADLAALKMAYESGNVLTAVASAEKYIAKYPSGASEAFARFVLAYGKWSLARSNPAATRADLTSCLSQFRTALLLGLSPTYEPKVLWAQGDLLSRLGLANEAVETYSELLDKYPSEKKALLELSVAYTQTRPADIEKAREAVNNYLAIEGLSPEDSQRGYLAKARMEISAGDFAAAASSAQRVLDANAAGEVAAEAVLILQKALGAQGDYAAALKAFDRADFASAGRLESALFLARGQCLARAGDAAEAQRTFEDAIFRFPGTAEALSARYELARLFFQTGQIDPAKDALVNLLDDMSAQQVVDTSDFTLSDVTDLWFDVGRAILEQKDYAAVRDFHSAAVALMSHGHFLFFDATLYLREAEQQESLLSGLPPQQIEAASAHIRTLYRQAGLAFTKALETAAGSLYAHSLFNAGHAFFLAGDYPAAVRFLSEFVANNLKDDRVPQANYEQASALRALGNYQAAIAVCQTNAANFPTNIYAYRSLLLQGDLYFLLGGPSLKLAAGTYDGILTDGRFLSSSAEWRRAIFALGKTLYMLGDFKGSMLKLDEALQRYPEDAGATEAQYYLGLASRQAAFDDPSMRSALLAGAASIFSRLASGENPYAAVAAFLEADCYYDQGDYARALALYDRAVEAHVDTPDATRALFQMANCYHRLGQKQQADATYKRAIFNLNRRQGAPAPGSDFYRSLAAWRGDAGAQI